MTHIPQETLAKLKQQLEERRDRLKAALEGVQAESPRNDADRLEDNTSDGDAREELKLIETEAVGNQVEEALTRVEAALDRMEKGTYGLTADGKEIPVERLLVDPSATTLVQ